MTGLESDLKIQQQKNACFEKQLEDAESKVKQVYKMTSDHVLWLSLFISKLCFQDELLAYG